MPPRGHGIVLLLFFTLTFIAQNVALVNINSKDWWFDMKDKEDRIEMSLFVTRYICTLFTFVLGLKAPGITSIASEDELLLDEDENEVRFKFILINLSQLPFVLGKPGKPFHL